MSDDGLTTESKIMLIPIISLAFILIFCFCGYFLIRKTHNGREEDAINMTTRSSASKCRTQSNQQTASCV